MDISRVVINGQGYMGTVVVHTEPEPFFNGQCIKPGPITIQVDVQEPFELENLKRIRELEDALKDIRDRYSMSPWIGNLVDKTFR